MARDFDGLDDNISIPAHASMHDWNVFTILIWMNPVGTGGGGQGRVVSKSASYQLKMSAGPSIALEAKRWATDGEWQTAAASLTLNQRQHIAASYDYGSTANVPIFYRDGAVLGSVTEIQAPVGTLASESDSIYLGNRNDAVRGFDGELGHIAIVNEVLTAAEINRARWWGRPKGGIAAYYPFFTNKLTNDGTVGLTVGTNTGSVVKSMAWPVVRPGSMMLGCGVGI